MDKIIEFYFLRIASESFPTNHYLGHLSYSIFADFDHINVGIQKVRRGLEKRLGLEKTRIEIQILTRI